MDEIWMFLQEFRNRPDVRQFVHAHAGSGLCVGTELVLGTVLLGLGVKSPDTGDRFVASRSMFDEASAHIAALVPDGGWQGSAAHAYSAQNLAQSQRAKLIGDFDHLTGDLVSAQAEAIQNARTVVFLIIVFVGFLLVICVTAELNGGPAGQILSYELALKGCILALSAVDACLMWLMITTLRHAGDLQGLTQNLTEMVTTLPTLLDITPGLPDPPLPPAHSPSEFDADNHTLPPTIAGLPNDTATLPGTPNIYLAFADLPGSPEFSVPTMPKPGLPDFGAPHLPIPHLAGIPSVADMFCGPGGLPGLDLANPATTTQPTVAPLTATLSQLTGLSGPAGRLNQLTNMADQAQMISSLARQAAQPPLSDHVTRDHDNSALPRPQPSHDALLPIPRPSPTQQSPQRVI